MVLTFGDLSGRGPDWFALFGPFGTFFSLCPVARAVIAHRRFAVVGVVVGAVLCGALM
ncbi:hypothetical protein AB0L59_02020 [Streptomyces sp. NPDC052109]|uniref:hypothetical protein n=1 Tax=Streptomyces sp. NPDC052109 TaxID=3155527 RepID=UPI0034326794